MTLEADAVEYTATDAEVARQIGEEIIKRRPLWLTTEEVEDAASNGTMAKTGRRSTIIATGSVITSPSSNDIEQWGGRTKPDPSKGRLMVRILDVKAPAATLRYSARQRLSLRDYGSPPFIIVADIRVLRRPQPVFASLQRDSVDPEILSKLTQQFLSATGIFDVDDCRRPNY